MGAIRTVHFPTETDPPPRGRAVIRRSSLSDSLNPYQHQPVQRIYSDIQEELAEAITMQEVRFFLRFAAQRLSSTERISLDGFALGLTIDEIAEKCRLTKSAIWMARKSGLAKMKKRLELIGVRSTQDLLGD